MIPIIGPSGKGKTMETVKISGCRGVGVGKGCVGRAKRNFRAVTL